jgi:hypothetical protein
MEVSGQLHARDALTPPPPGEKATGTQWIGLDGPQSQSERGGEDKMFLVPTGNRIPVVQPIAVTILTELPRLLGNSNRVSYTS